MHKLTLKAIRRDTFGLTTLFKVLSYKIIAPCYERNVSYYWMQRVMLLDRYFNYGIDASFQMHFGFFQDQFDGHIRNFPPR